MALLEMTGPMDVEDPTLVLAISGWVDAGMVATKIGEHLAADGDVAAIFSPDEIFDYQSSRPTLEIAGGSTSQIRFPALTVTAVRFDDTHLVVVSGREPNTRWLGIATELAGLATTVGVTRVVAIGAVPAMVAHTRPTPIIVTSTDPALPPSGVPADRLVVPAALVNVLSHHVAGHNDVPEVGFWAQVPHYVSGAYWPGVEALMTRMSVNLGIMTDTEEIRDNAREMLERLDEAVAERPEAQELIRRLEDSAPGFTLDDDADLTEEIENFLRSLDDDPG